jgi:hypothetical protein
VVAAIFEPFGLLGALDERLTMTYEKSYQKTGKESQKMTMRCRHRSLEKQGEVK